MPATQITRTMLAQIGSGNILATSGGRVYVSEDGDTVTMPVATIQLVPGQTLAEVQ